MSYPFRVSLGISSGGGGGKLSCWGEASPASPSLDETLPLEDSVGSSLVPRLSVLVIHLMITKLFLTYSGGKISRGQVSTGKSAILEVPLGIKFLIMLMAVANCYNGLHIVIMTTGHYCNLIGQ